MTEARVYTGSRHADGTTVVTVNGIPLDRRVTFRAQTTTTFDWGYAGAGGPAQLALAILVDHWGDEDRARRHYEHFVRRVISHLPGAGWTLTELDIDSVL